MTCRRPHPVLASFVAALAMIMPLAVMSFVEINSDPVGLPSGEIDDAGMRGAGLTILALPFIYIICVLLCHASGYILLRFGFRTLRQFLLFPLVVSVALGLLVSLALSNTTKIELADIAMSFLAVSSVLGAIGGVGAAVWWWLAVKPYNSSLNPGSSGGLA